LDLCPLGVAGAVLPPINSISWDGYSGRCGQRCPIYAVRALRTTTVRGFKKMMLRVERRRRSRRCTSRRF
jgi:hypothetical protein